MRWQDHAACKGARSDLFFPIGDTEEDEDAAEAANLSEAKEQYCDTCPAFIHCAKAAVNEPYGIQAGRTGRQRRESAQARQSNP